MDCFKKIIIKKKLIFLLFKNNNYNNIIKEMFYCKNCLHTLEIIKNTNLASENNIVQIESAEELVDIFFNDLESKKNSYINSDYQHSIIWPESELDKLDYKHIIKTYGYSGSEEELKKKLSAMFKQIVKFQKSISNFFFSCTNCATTYYLEPGAIIESINYERSEAISMDDAQVRVDDPTLMRTKDYICPNTKCVTNTKTSDKNVMMEKEAVFYRSGKEYNIKYICCKCNTQWGT